MDKKDTTLNEKQSFPLKKIEALIKLANMHGLEMLAVGSIKIVPAPKRTPLLSGYGTASPKPDEDKEPGRRPLTKAQQDDIILFGEPIIEDDA